MDIRSITQLPSLDRLALKEMDGLLLAQAILAAPAVHHHHNVLADAIRFAAFYHRNDTRASRMGMPRTHYIEHPLRVCLRLVRWGVTDWRVLAAAILHDVVEDHAFEVAFDYSTDDAFEVIERLFGATVRRVVDGLTNPESEPGADRVTRNAQYAAHVTDAISDQSVLMVKFSDFADNALSLHHHEHIEGMAKRLATKYLPLVSVFEAALTRPEVRNGPFADVAEEMLAALSKNRLAELADA